MATTTPGHNQPWISSTMDGNTQGNNINKNRLNIAYIVEWMYVECALVKKLLRSVLQGSQGIKQFAPICLSWGYPQWKLMGWKARPFCQCNFSNVQLIRSLTWTCIRPLWPNCVCLIEPAWVKRALYCKHKEKCHPRTVISLGFGCHTERREWEKQRREHQHKSSTHSRRSETCTEMDWMPSAGLVQCKQ